MIKGMIGNIKWHVKRESDGSMRVSSVDIFDIDDSKKVQTICTLFKDISFPKNKPLKGTEYEAWIHFQNGRDLFCCSPDGSVDRRLPEIYCFGQDKLFADASIVKQMKPMFHVSTINLLEKEPAFQGIPRYSAIMDSSIWNYYFNFEDYYKDEEYKKNHLACVLYSIAHNTDLGIYDLSVAREYADLHARILLQSYLVGSHKAISPFLFHSEIEMRKKIEDMVLNEKGKINEKIIEKVKEHKWRFLLVDDKSIKCMSKVSLNDDNSKDVNKLQIISNNISRILGFNEEKIWFRTDFKESQDHQKMELIPQKYGRVKDCIWNKDEFTIANKKPDVEENIQIIIDCVENIEDAIKCLNYFEYEIVLLDYLLDDHSNRKQEYGYQFLNYLYKYKNDSYQSENERIIIGPNNRLSIMFISAFTTAVNERILEKGFGRSERGLWFIGNNACPTNTPFLFSYFLLQLMRHRIEVLKNGSEGQLFTIIDLLEEIYVKIGNSGIESVRKEANSHFNHLLFMRAKYKRLMNDLNEKEEKDLKEHHNKSQYIANYLMNMKSSLLVYSTFKVVHHFSKTFFDHLQHLVYLTAFGTIRQWQDMWEEYVFVYKELYDYDKYVVEYDNNNNVKKRGKMICNAIKEYIINLKENSI